jgi:hypothetical protein
MKSISYDHPKFDEIKREAERLLNREFSFIPLDMVEKYADGNLFEHIVPVAFSRMLEDFDPSDLFESDLFEEYEETGETVDREAWAEDESFVEWLEENYNDDVREAYEEYDNNYPMWGTVFVANDNWLSDKIEKEAEKVQACGFGVINSFKNMNAALFVAGAGYDFYEAHWIPFFTEFLDWIKVTETV